MFRGLGITIALSVSLFVSRSAVADMVGGSTVSPLNSPDYDAKARQVTASLLNSLNQSLDMTIGQVAASHPEGGNVNANDLNSARSTSTYHRYLWDYCLKWAGRACLSWFPAGVSIHAFNGDRSPLEGVIGQYWQQLKNVGTAQNPSNRQYQIWDVQSRYANILDQQGRLDRNRIDKIALKQPVAAAAANVGFETARRTMSLVMNEGAAKGQKAANPDKSLPPPETLRMMAGRWTLMMRNNLLRMIGEMRTSMKGVEVAQGEDISRCRQYFGLLQTQQEYTKQERRLQPQGLLDLRTKGKSDAERLRLCMQAYNMNAYVVNARVQGNQWEAGPINGERADIRDARVNLAMIDAGGIDANEVPSNREYTRAEESNELGDYEEGGVRLNKVNATNREQFLSNNKIIQEAAEDYDYVASRIPNLKNKSGQIRDKQYVLMSRNLVDYNDMTPEMRRSLNGTEFTENEQNIASGKAAAPHLNLAQSPGELVMQRAAH